MRGMFCKALLSGGLLLWCCGFGSANDTTEAKTDEGRLEAAHLKLDGESLLDIFRKRTVGEKDLEKVKGLIRQLGDESFKAREHAVAELIMRGPVVVELLKEAQKSPDLEVIRRAERCLQRIKDKDYRPEVLPAAARLIAQRKPAGAVEALLAYLPFADNEQVADEVRTTLSGLAVRDGKADQALVAALTDKLPVRRAAAGEALCRGNVVDEKAAVRRLLQDPEPTVRLRVAVALACARDRDAVLVIIDALPQLSQTQAWQAEEFLLRLAEGRHPPAVSLGSDAAARRKARDAWADWWKANGSMVDLATLRVKPQLLGYTLIVLLDEGRVMELDRNNNVRWQLANINFPLDAQVLPGDRVLIAEYEARKVTERNHKGEILWEEPVTGSLPITGPLAAQRLPNGNTFIATDERLIEVDRNHKEVFSHTLPAGQKVMKVAKLPNGDIVCLTSQQRVVRLDATGKELHSFPVELGLKLYGGRLDVLPGGRVLVPHNAENKVVEYDSSGKEVWRVNIDQPVAAVRLPNGNTLVTTMTQFRAVEFDRYGNEVWEYRAKQTRVTRAYRR
jgi:HEAT repeat protein